MGSLLAALGLVFVAELGDKTQLVALGLGARHRLAPVLVGVALAYAASNLLSVIVGGLLGAALPTRAIGLGGGVLFLVFAAWNLRADHHEHGDGGAGAGAGAGRRVVLSVAVAMFVAEMGDKTQLVTATLAAQGNPLLVWMGATVGITLSGSVGVVVGRAAGSALPEQAIRLGSSALFALYGGILIATNL
ncbi:MAG TPA: TMEM165/GDT1 family protein [Acidimicrobiales bacterium]